MNARQTSAEDPPEPPFDDDLLAEYDAGALSPELAAHVSRRLSDDPRGREVLAGLAALRARLAAAEVESADLPTAAEDRLRALLRALGNTSP
ncbi:MAG: hypothetical protein QM809_04300 [Gordonia sp. (in: high G+C Gram-positive bacteria)]|uniref:hypothetical protein n=1 Tax=Gordonia sp. (in: high G+C Gram-positive bacteria) TaxID=84139 RepID=UPI0039E37AAF